MIIVLTGVSGCGKTTIGMTLASLTGMPFYDADDNHTAANKQKMAAGHPLDDADRQPWLETLNAKMREWATAGDCVLACSALKQSYRDTLSDGLPPDTVRFVLLQAPRVAQWLAARHHAFMNPALLDSQLQTLEPLRDGIEIINDREPAIVAAEILKRLPVQASGPMRNLAD